MITHIEFAPIAVGTKPSDFTRTNIKVIDDKTAKIHTEQTSTGIEDFTVRMLDNCRFVLWTEKIQHVEMTVNFEMISETFTL